MSDCPFHSRLDAYHDGELSAVEAAQIERHLAVCESCSAVVANLRELSQAMVQVEPATMSQIELARLHRNLDVARDRSLFRFSTALATIAASVLIISLTWIAQTPAGSSRPISRSPDSNKDWYRMAMGEPPPVPTINHNFGLPDTDVAYDRNNDLARWMLDGIH
jgi:predicted anti-sigma-YlaC factor YlaD